MADLVMRETDKQQSSDSDSVYGWFPIVGIGTGIGVFFACKRWAESWSGLSPEDLARKGPEPLAAQYPWLAALVAVLLVLILVRVYVFMRRLESR